MYLEVRGVEIEHGYVLEELANLMWSSQAANH